MANDIIGSMFGTQYNPMDDYRRALAQNSQMSMDHPLLETGTMIGMLGAKAMGLKTREEQVAENRQQIASMIKDESPESYIAAAQKAQELGDTQAATMLVQKANEAKVTQSKLAYEAAKTKKEEALTEDIPKQKHDEAMARISQAADAAKQRSEDTRLGIEQRRQAAKEHNDLMKYLAEIKIGQSTAGSESGQNTVNNLTTGLRDYYNQLKEAGAIVDPNKGVLSNIAASISSSGLGQVAGGTVGSKVQTVRDAISQQRPLLLQAIKQATGMSSKQMDSNTELQMYLKVATDPKLSVKANMDALDKIEQLYGVGGIGIPKPAKGKETTTMSIPSGMIDMEAVRAEIARRKGGK